MADPNVGRGGSEQVEVVRSGGCRLAEGRVPGRETPKTRNTPLPPGHAACSLQSPARWEVQSLAGVLGTLSAPARARTADGAAGLLSALRASGARRGAAGEPGSEPKPGEVRILPPRPAGRLWRGSLPAFAGQVFAHPSWSGAAMRSGSGAEQVLPAPSLSSRREPTKARAGAGAWGQRCGALRMKGAARVGQAAARSGRRLPGVSSSRLAGRTHRAQPPGPRSLGLARCARRLDRIWAPERGAWGPECDGAFSRWAQRPAALAPATVFRAPLHLGGRPRPARGPAGASGTSHSPAESSHKVPLLGPRPGGGEVQPATCGER